MRNLWKFVLLMAGTLGTTILPAAADTSYTLNLGNLGGLDCCTGPYATADVHLNSGTKATITFDSLTNGGYLYLMAGVNAVDVNVNATSWTLGTVTGSNSLGGFTPGPYTDTFSGTVDGFGVFNERIKSYDGFTHSATEISFTLDNLSGTWADSSGVLIANSSGHTVGIHGFACAQPGCSISSGAFATGFATNGTAPIPEPEIYAMLAAGLGLMGFVARRRKGTSAALSANG